jgi:hypothetical protein
MPAVGDAQVDIFTCKPWSNGGLRMRGDVQLELSGLNLMWINGKNTQTVAIMNPSPDNQLNINRTIVSVRVSKQNTTKCHPLD